MYPPDEVTSDKISQCVTGGKIYLCVEQLITILTSIGIKVVTGCIFGMKAPLNDIEGHTWAAISRAAVPNTVVGVDIGIEHTSINGDQLSLFKCNPINDSQLFRNDGVSFIYEDRDPTLTAKQAWKSADTEWFVDFFFFFFFSPPFVSYLLVFHTLLHL